MKRVIIVAILALGFTTGAMAQNNAYISTFGIQTDASGVKTIIDPSTIIAVDITIKKEQNIVGPYARYAQKYLDARGSLVDRTTYRIDNVLLSLVRDAHFFESAEVSAPRLQTLSHNGSTTEFAKILPDKMNNEAQSLDAAAQDAAAMIFSIRRHRMELITGEAGENVFGGGLKEALDALDKQEQALLELFFGKNIITTTTERFYVAVEAGKSDYTITHFSKNTGLGSTGEAVVLNITPSGKNALSTITEADSREKSVTKVRVADLASCAVKVGEDATPIKIRVLPVFEFGRTISIPAPVTK